MSSVVAKVDELAAKIGSLATAAGRDVIEVFDEIIAHVEGKHAEVVQQTTDKEAENAPGNVSEVQVGQISTASTDSTSNTTAETGTEAKSQDTDSSNAQDATEDQKSAS